jgi:hypothetical protein
MTFTTVEVIEAIRGLLEAENGLAASIEGLKGAYQHDEDQPAAASIQFHRAPAEMQEKAKGTRYPQVHIYCDRIESRPTERLRRFSGRIRVVAEIRVSGDRLDGMTDSLHFYVDGVRDVVERNAGCMRDGLYLSNEYEVQIEPVKKGGLNFIQTARIACAVVVNRS